MDAGGNAEISTVLGSCTHTLAPPVPQIPLAPWLGFSLLSGEPSGVQREVEKWTREAGREWEGMARASLKVHAMDQQESQEVSDSSLALWANFLLWVKSISFKKLCACFFLFVDRE